MDSLRIDRSGYTLVDQVEEKLIQYFKEQGLRPGSSIPNENELAASLGIGRTVLREALSRFKTRRAELAAKGKLVTHRDLLERIKAGDTEGYKEALKHHFDLYKDCLKRTRTDAEGLIREIIEAAL